MSVANQGSSALKTTMKELEQMERRLKTVQENLLTKEERVAREKNKFQMEKRKCTALLNVIQKDLCERDDIKRTRGNCRDAMALNAKCRMKLNDAEEMVRSLLLDARTTKNVAGEHPSEKQQAIINQKENASKHVETMYNLCREMYEKDPENRGEAQARKDLLADIPVEEPGFFQQLFGKKKEQPRQADINLNPDNLMVVGGGGQSQMEAQWMQLLEESDQMEAQYLEVIEQNLDTLKELAIAMGDELDKQAILLDDVGTKIDRNQKKIDSLNTQVDKAAAMTRESNRCIYIIIFVVIAAIVAFILVKFVFKV